MNKSLEDLTLVRMLDDLFEVILIDSSFIEYNDFKSLIIEKPSSLLPLSNLNVLDYQLNWLENNEIINIIMIIPQNFHTQVQNYLNETYKGSINVKLYSFSIDTSSIDILKYLIKENIVCKDFMLLPTNTIGSVNLRPVFESYITTKPDLLCCMASDVLETFVENPVKGLDHDFASVVGIDSRSNRIAFINSARQYLPPRETISNLPLKDMNIAGSILDTFNNIQVRYDLLDCNIYIFNYDVVYYLTTTNNIMSSICSQLVPLIINCQFMNITQLNELAPDLIRPRFSKTSRLLVVNNSDCVWKSEKIYEDFEPEEDESNEQIDDQSSSKKRNRRKKKKPKRKVVDVVYQLTHRYPFLQTFHNVLQYKDLCLLLIESEVLNHIVPIHRGMSIDSSKKEVFTQHPFERITSVCDESVIMGENVKIQNSLIGKNVTIGNHVTITNCIVMEGSQISDNIILDNTILCDAAIIGLEGNSDCVLKDCVVSPQVSVPRGKFYEETFSSHKISLD
eukprot:TRINITY_DN2892_c0_g1_i1.p1 TRINITY_DN2892_c0_g1~~TRINITY_DN2892_c0_g1_i1.p1  ORF type:complete len:508 (+),score=116.66 TRINITY_DN2892_c0_g1_i1:42-1565(+)